MGISLSSINNVGLEQFITTSSSGEPNWSYIPTKGKSTKTQAEFVSEIKELAQKAAETTKQNGIGKYSETEDGTMCGISVRCCA